MSEALSTKTKEEIENSLTPEDEFDIEKEVDSDLNDEVDKKNGKKEERKSNSLFLKGLSKISLGLKRPSSAKKKEKIESSEVDNFKEKESPALAKEVEESLKTEDYIEEAMKEPDLNLFHEEFRVDTRMSSSIEAEKSRKRALSKEDKRSSGFKTTKRRGPARRPSSRPTIRRNEKPQGFNLPFVSRKTNIRLRIIYNILTDQGLRVGVGGFLFLVAFFADFANDYQPETIHILFLIPYVLFTIPVLLRILINLGRKKFFDENLLVFLATAGAFTIQMYWESVGVLLMYHIALLIEGIVMKRTKKTISDNIDFKAATANLKRGNVIEVVEPSVLRPKQIIVIMPGEKIPVDAMVTLGNSMVDTKALTGEAEPSEVRVGHKIFSGCINLSGVIEARVLKVYEESTAMKILELVGNAEEKKPEQERSMEFFMRLYTPGAIVSSLLIMLLPPLFFPDQDPQLWIVRALTFLVAACPVGLLASIPLAYLGGVGAALKQGILVKGAVYLERLAKTEAFLFDKTGTLTEGFFRVKRIVPRNLPESELLRIAAYGEAFSSHPIAASLRKAYGRRINTKRISDMREESGFGVNGIVDGMNVIIGNSRYLGEYGIFSRPVRDVGTAVHVAINGDYAGYILLADHPRPEVDRLIRWLQRRKHEVVMLSGDNKRVVDDMAEELGIKTAFSSLMPEDKLDYLNIYLESQMGEGYVAFVGDGLNDALVLSEADVGIGMGGLGADAALEAADIVLLEDEPVKIINAIRISKSVNRTVRYNITLVLLMKIILLSLAATGLITMGRAVLADVGVMFILMLNSFWLLKHPERNK